MLALKRAFISPVEEVESFPLLGIIGSQRHVDISTCEAGTSTQNQQQLEEVIQACAETLQHRQMW